jgi:hypothetical protein
MTGEESILKEQMGICSDELGLEMWIEGGTWWCFDYRLCIGIVAMQLQPRTEHVLRIEWELLGID